MKKIKILNFQNIEIKGNNIEFISYPLREFQRENNDIYIVFMEEPQKYLSYFLNKLQTQYSSFTILQQISKLQNCNDIVETLEKNNFIPIYDPQTFFLDTKKRPVIAMKNLEKFDYVVPMNKINIISNIFKIDIKVKENNKIECEKSLNFIKKDTKVYNFVQSLWNMIQLQKFQSLQEILKYKGVIDRITQKEIKGWAFIKDKKDPAEVELYINNILVKVIKANRFRPDLKEKKNHPTGECGFIFELDKEIKGDNKIEVKIKNTTYKLKYGNNVSKKYKGE